MNWTLAAVGDVMLTREPKESAAIFLLREADLSSANLEVPLSRDGHPADKPVVLRALPEVAAHLPAMGLGVVSMANNHSLDYGVPAFLETIQAVEAAGVRVTGAGVDLHWALRPILVERAGVSIAWLAFASTLPAGFAAGPERPGIAPLRVQASAMVDGAISDEQPGTSPFVTTEPYPEDLERAVEAVRRAREMADVVILNVHWGVPPGFAAGFQGVLAQYQRPLARALVEAGATVLLGHHPHTLHGVEILGESLVLYSIGHFIFHALAADQTLTLARPGPPYRIEAMMVPELRETAIFLFGFDGPLFRRLEIVPCLINEEGESELATGEKASSILDRVRRHSGEFGVDIKVEGERGVLLL